MQASAVHLQTQFFLVAASLDASLMLCGRCGIRGPAYLQQLEEALQQASRRFQPDYIVYNAGTDVLTGDPLGR